MPTALVTGASRGIGAAIARRLAHDGFDLAIHYHQDEAGAQATREAVLAAGRSACLLQGDLGDVPTARRIARAAEEQLGDVQVFVNNAGIYDRTAWDAMDDAAWRRTMAVDLDGPAAISQELGQLLRRGAGSIVHISSVVAVRGSSHGAHYTAAKAALLGLTKAQARELAPCRVNAVCPGYIDTDILAGDTQDKRRRREAEVPLGRVGTPDDIAGAVSFLCGPDAGYMTGQTLHVNGGLWMS